MLSTPDPSDTPERLGGHDAELTAAELVRRAERGIGVTIRKGQDAGVLLSQGQRPPRGVDSAATNSLGGAFSNPDERRATYAMTDGVSDEEFEEALSEAKVEGNLSRAEAVPGDTTNYFPKPSPYDSVAGRKKVGVYSLSPLWVKITPTAGRIYWVPSQPSKRARPERVANRPRTVGGSP